jgi:hypothetical protein
MEGYQRRPFSSDAASVSTSAVRSRLVITRGRPRRGRSAAGLIGSVIVENPELPAALVRQARLLRSCLQVYSAAYDEGLLNARDGSPAHMDFQQAEHGPTGKPWPDYFAAGPRDSAITLIRAQADL